MVASSGVVPIEEEQRCCGHEHEGEYDEAIVARMAGSLVNVLVAIDEVLERLPHPCVCVCVCVYGCTCAHAHAHTTS